jgi:hypothetical protein
MNSRTILTLIAGGLAAFFLPREQARGTFAELDRGHVEWLLANRSQAIPAERFPVIFARLDDLDHPENERQFEAWPPTPLEWHGLLGEAATLEPRTLVVSTAQAWASQPPDASLDQASPPQPGLHLGTRAEAQGAVEATALARLPQVVGDSSVIPQFAVVPGESRLSVMGKLSISQVDLSDNPLAKPTLSGGVFRLPLLFRQGDQVVPALALSALLYQAKIPLEQVEVTLGKSIKARGLPDIPVDGAGGFSLNVLPINAQPFPHFTVDTFKMDAAQRERFLAKDDPVRGILPQIKNALLWVGEDHREARHFPLADGQSVSLSELSLRALQAMQSGRNVAPQSVVWQWLTLGAMLLYGVWLARLNRVRLWKWALFGAMLLGLASLLTFQSGGIWMPVGPGLVLLAIIWLVNLVVPGAKVA